VLPEAEVLIRSYARANCPQLTGKPVSRCAALVPKALQLWLMRCVHPESNPALLHAMYKRMSDRRYAHEACECFMLAAQLDNLFDLRGLREWSTTADEFCCCRQVTQPCRLLVRSRLLGGRRSACFSEEIFGSRPDAVLGPFDSNQKVWSMSGDWQSNWNAEAELRPGKPNTPCILLSLSLRASLNAYHDLSTESAQPQQSAWYRCFAAAPKGDA